MARSRMRKANEKNDISQNIKRNHEERTVSFIELWDEIASSHINKNNSNYGELRLANFYIDMLGIYSGENKISYIYSIDGYPNELELAYRSTLRSCCRGETRISFITPLEKHRIDWGSAQMRAKLHTWKVLEQDGGDVDEYNLYENLQTLDSQDWRKESLVYLSTAEIRRKRKMFKLRSLMVVSGNRGVDFNDTNIELVKLCRQLQIKISRIIGDIPDFMSTFSPFSNSFDSKVLNDCGCVVLPDELVARFNTYSQGIIGRSGVYWGTDIYSLFPCLKPVKRTSETAENWLITAETGGGKSFMVKGLLVQLLADPIYNGTIMDVEGFEYIPMANYLANNDLVVIINMGEGTGAYFDPVEIILTGDPELDRDMKSLSTSFTLSIFKTLLGNSAEQDDWNDIVINDAVSITYAQHNVTEDMETWKNAKGLTLYDVYATLKSLLTAGNGDAERAVNNAFSQSLYAEKLGYGNAMSQNDVERLISSNKGYQHAIEMCIAKVSRYFEPTGVRAHLFKERITVDSIIDAKLAICSFGMAGKAPNTVDPIQMALMQLYAANISHLRSVFSKQHHKYNFKLWEEFQRWGGFPDADKTINVALTGGRKLGDINIIITNKVRDMLDDDKFGVFSNITSFAIGAIGDSEVREELCTRLTIPEMQGELDAIAENNKDLDAYINGDTLMQNPYSKAFLLGLDRTVYTIGRMTIPEELRNSHIFRTGIDLGDNNKEDNIYEQ